jgi:two-component system osmolarity sensor histidine kinase EnvZ
VKWGPQTLFGRTAVLIAVALCAFSVIAWQAIIWTSLVPAAQGTVQQLAAKARVALAAHDAKTPLPVDTRFESGPAPTPRLIRGFAFSAYVESVRTQLQRELQSPEVRITRMVAPSEIWVRVTGADQWLVLSWRFAGPRAPFAALSLLGGAAVIVLLGAAVSARRLTAPLAGLAHAAGQVAEGRSVSIDTQSGPAEVRELAHAFQAMSNRLSQLDGQRELMLGGISHDLRTPLARVRVAVELLQDQDPALIAEMAASIEEMDRMVGQFLHYVRANYQESPSVAVLDNVVRESLAMYGADARLRFDLQAAAPHRFAVQCVRHTVLNLVHNALEYGKAPVLIATRIAQGRIELSVFDAGKGLTQTQWREALQPFHRLNAGANSEASSDHSGIGLALIERLVSNGGGTLHAEQHPNGFRVTISLPAQT